MAVTARAYPNGQKHIIAGDIDSDGDTIKCALVLNTYTPADSHEFFDTSVDTYETTGTGYTDGGQALGSKSVTLTLANSWATTWAASTAYTVGDVVRPTTGNGHLYVCQTAGTSDSGEPTWPTIARADVTDNTVTWVEVGVGIVVWDAANPAWTNSTITARYAVFYRDGTAGVSDYLISYLNFGQDESSSADTFGITIDPTGITRTFIGV